MDRRVVDEDPQTIGAEGREVLMQVREGMSEMVLTVGPGHTLSAVARLMSERAVGAAVVMDPDGNGPGIITERDILIAVGDGQDPAVETRLRAPHARRGVRRSPTGHWRRPPPRWCAAASGI